MNLFQSLNDDKESISLSGSHKIDVYRSVPPFTLNQKAFDELWDKHPEQFHTIVMHGKKILTPRWQQSYGKNYNYAGSVNNALPIPDDFQKYLEWARTEVDKRINGLLLNWYDGSAGHYIGAHRDDTRDLMEESPIITISLGQERVFRMRPYQGSGFKDVLLQNGDALIMPPCVN
jgi:alkylated DNA repair dioxygenase AlkB